MLNAATNNKEEGKYLEEYYEVVKARLASRGRISARINSDNLVLPDNVPEIITHNNKAVGPKSKKRKPNSGTNN